jgi:hypothetical protein
MIDTYRSRRRSQIGENWREPGEPVPEAHLWRLTDGLVRHGQLEPVQLSEADFAAAVSRYCPGEEDAIYAVLGLTPARQPAVKSAGRTRPAKTVAATGPTRIDENSVAGV